MSDDDEDVSWPTDLSQVCPELNHGNLTTRSSSELANTHPAFVASMTKMSTKKLAPMTVIVDTKRHLPHPSRNSSARRTTSVEQTCITNVKTHISHKKTKRSDAETPTKNNDDTTVVAATIISESQAQTQICFVPDVDEEKKHNDITTLGITAVAKTTDEVLSLSRPSVSTLCKLGPLMRLLQKTFEKTCRDNMLVFVDDFQHYRAFSRFVTVKSQSTPDTQQMLRALQDARCVWKKEDTVDSIYCCAFTNRHRLHVLSFLLIQQESPQLLHNLVFFTHWANAELHL